MRGFWVLVVAVLLSLSHCKIEYEEDGVIKYKHFITDVVTKNTTYTLKDLSPVLQSEMISPQATFDSLCQLRQVNADTYDKYGPNYSTMGDFTIFVPDRTLIYHGMNPIGTTVKNKNNVLDSRIRPVATQLHNNTFYAMSEGTIYRWYVDSNKFIRQSPDWALKPSEKIRDFRITRTGVLVLKQRHERTWRALSKQSFSSIFSKTVF